MTMILLKVGLVLTPFYEILVKLFPMAVVQTPDTRMAKSFLTMWLALAIGLSALFLSEIRMCKNKWILFFIAFIPLSIHLSPQYNIELNGVMSPNYWVWKPFVEILCYFLMFTAIQSLRINRQSVKSILTVMVWCGTIMAVYVLIQNTGWDQFFNKRTGGVNNNFFFSVTKPITVGTLGNSTIVSPYLAILVPLSIYLKRHVSTIMLICAVLACHSHVATGAMILSLIAYSCLKCGKKLTLVVFLAVLLALSVASWSNYFHPKEFRQARSRIFKDNGRVEVWKSIIIAMREKEFGIASKTRHPFTGLGLGSYPIVMKPEINTIFAQAHNEYIEVLCQTGWVGLILFLCAIGHMLKKIFNSYLDGLNRAEITALTSSFICAALIACGTFIWQIAPTIYLSVIVVGLLHNRNLLKGELE